MDNKSVLLDLIHAQIFEDVIIFLPCTYQYPYKFLKRSQKRTVIQFIHSNRNRRTDMFSKKSVLKNFAKFQGSSFVRISFFDEVVDLRPTTLFKKKQTLTWVFT